MPSVSAHLSAGIPFPVALYLHLFCAVGTHRAVLFGETFACPAFSDHPFDEVDSLVCLQALTVALLPNSNSSGPG